MIIDCISDLHGYYPVLPGGDLLIMAGDYTKSDKIAQWAEFFAWLKKQDYSKKILIAGNHDNFLESCFPHSQQETDNLKEVQSWLDEQEIDGCSDFEYLCDSGTEFLKMKIWGSPWTSYFDGMNPNCMAFTICNGCDTDNWLLEKWNLIPEDTDILVTHSPVYSYLDYTAKERNVGSQSLLCRTTIIKPKLHVFGHVHEGYGMEKRAGFDGIVVNASHTNEHYDAINPPIRIIL